MRTTSAHGTRTPQTRASSSAASVGRLRNSNTMASWSMDGTGSLGSTAEHVACHPFSPRNRRRSLARPRPWLSEFRESGRTGTAPRARRRNARMPLTV
jgi:hypothetical protein